MSSPSPPTRSAPASLRRRLASGTVWTLVGRLVSIGSLLGINGILRRGLSDADYAAFALASATAIFLGLPAALGLPKVLLRAIRDPRTTESPSTLRACLLNAGLLVPLGCLAFALVIVVMAQMTPTSPKWHAVQEHPLLVSLWMSGLAITLLLSHALQGFDRFLASAIVGARSGGVLANLLAVGACWGLWAGDQLTVANVLAVNVAANLLAVALGVWIVSRQVLQLTHDANEIASPRPKSDNSDDQQPLDVSKRWFLAESLPNLLIQVTSTGIAQAEMLIMGCFANDENIADYNLVLRLMDLLVASHSLAATIVMPFIAELYARKDLRRLESLLRGAASLVAVPTTIMAFLFLAFPDAVLTFLFGTYGAYAVAPLRIATVAASISCYAGANALTMVMTGRQRTLLRASIIAAVCQLAAAPPMIILDGARGAAIVTLVVFGSYNVVVTLMVRWRVGVWTIPTFSPQKWKAAIDILKQRLRRRPGPAASLPDVAAPEAPAD